MVESCCFKMLNCSTGCLACTCLSVKHKLKLPMVIPMFKSGHTSIYKLSIPYLKKNSEL